MVILLNNHKKFYSDSAVEEGESNGNILRIYFI